MPADSGRCFSCGATVAQTSVATDVLAIDTTGLPPGATFGAVTGGLTNARTVGVTGGRTGSPTNAPTIDVAGGVTGGFTNAPTGAPGIERAFKGIDTGPLRVG